MAEQEKEKLTEEPKKDLAAAVGTFIKNYIIDVFVVLLVAIYILKNVATVGIAEKDILTLFADCAVTLFFAQVIKELMSRRGIMIGQSSAEFKKVYADYDNVLHSCKGFIGNLDAFCEELNKSRLKAAQEEILLAHGVTYEQFRGGVEVKTDYQKKGIEKALKVKVAYLKSKDLTAETVGGRKSYDLGRPIDKYLKNKSVTGVLLTVCATVLFAYFELKPIEEFSWSALIWSAVQVVYFSAKGVFSLISSLMFVQGEYTNRIIRKTTYLQQFYNEYKNKTEEGGVPNGKESI